MSRRTKEANRVDKERGRVRRLRRKLQLTGRSCKENGLPLPGTDDPAIWHDPRPAKAQTSRIGRSPFHPEADAPHESGDSRLYWWNHPTFGDVLVFDPHGLVVEEAKRYYARLAALSGERYAFIVHGYNNGHALRDAMYRFFGREFCETYRQNPGVSRVELQ